MKKALVFVALMASAFTISSASVAKADHLSGCGPRGGFNGGDSYAPSYYSGYSYEPSYYAPSYYAPSYVYGYSPVNSFGYSYPSAGFYYGSPRVSVSIGSSYGTGGYGNYSTGGFGGGRSYHHHW